MGMGTAGSWGGDHPLGLVSPGFLWLPSDRLSWAPAIPQAVSPGPSVEAQGQVSNLCCPT